MKNATNWQLFYLVLLYQQDLQGEYYSPPSVALSYSGVKLTEVNINWGKDGKIRKADSLDLAGEQQIGVKAGQEDFEDLEIQEFAILDLTISVWRDGEQIQLDVNRLKEYNIKTQNLKLLIQAYFFRIMQLSLKFFFSLNSIQSFWYGQVVSYSQHGQSYYNSCFVKNYSKQCLSCANRDFLLLPALCKHHLVFGNFL